MTVRVDRTAPATPCCSTARRPPARTPAPCASTSGSPTAPARAKGGTEFRVDDSAWTPYAAAFTVAGDGLHRVEYRSVDAAGNAETGAPGRVHDRDRRGHGGQPTRPAARARAEAGAVGRPGLGGAVAVDHRGVPARQAPRDDLRQSVERGTIRLTVSRKVARRLDLESRTLARAQVTCEGAETTVTLEPGRAVRRELAGRKGGSVRATLTVRLSGEDGTASDSASLTLRR